MQAEGDYAFCVLIGFEHFNHFSFSLFPGQRIGMFRARWFDYLYFNSGSLKLILDCLFDSRLHAYYDHVIMICRRNITTRQCQSDTAGKITADPQLFKCFLGIVVPASDWFVHAKIVSTYSIGNVFVFTYHAIRSPALQIGIMHAHPHGI